MAAKPQSHRVEPIKGLAPWVGGKRNLAARLVAKIERTPHHCYAEPFIGMGGVFFRRRRAAPVEVINDKSGEVVNLFRVVKHHGPALFDELRLTLHGRAELARLCRADPEDLTDIQRAARFFSMQRMNYGGVPGNRSFPVSWQRSRAIRAPALQRYLDLAWLRLSRVVIEHMDYARFIRAYDSAETLFYLDPPYWGCENHYGKGLFARADFERLAELLRGLKGRFILSINDVPEIRRLFRWARIEREAVTYRVKGIKKVTELVISGQGRDNARRRGRCRATRGRADSRPRP